MRLVVDVQEVAVVERLQAEVVELQVALGLERRAEARRGRTAAAARRAARPATPFLMNVREVLGVARVHVGLQHLLAEDLAPDRVQQQPRGGARVARILLDQRARGEDRRLVHLVDRHAVVEVAARLGEDRRGATSAPRPAHADSMSACRRARSSGTR